MSAITLTTNTNDWNPADILRSGTATTFLRFITTANISLSGLLAQDGESRFVSLYNVGSFDLTLLHQSSLSAEVNRFSLPNVSNFVITPGTGVLLYYDGDNNNRWTILNTLNYGLNWMPWVDPMDFGAIGDGVADDTTAFQNALNAAAATQRWVQVRPGRYRITAQLNMRQHHMRIVGMGREEYPGFATATAMPVTALIWDGAAGGTLLYNGTAAATDAHVSGCEITDIALYGDNGGNRAARGLHLHGVVGGTYKVSVEGFSGAGVYMDTDAFQASPANWGNQHNFVDIVGIQQGFAGSILECQGTATSNTCFNRFRVTGSYGDTGNGVLMGNTDDNIIEHLVIFHSNNAEAGKYGLIFAAAANPQHSRKNRVAFASINPGNAANVGIYFQGTEIAGTPATENIIEWLDNQGNPLVLYGTAATLNRILRNDEWWRGMQTAATITANQNDYAAGGTGADGWLAHEAWRIQGDAARNITGLVAIPNAIRTFFVVGSFAITFQHNNAGSVAANRMLMRNGVDLAVASGESVTLRYDPGSAVWREMADSA